MNSQFLIGILISLILLDLIQSFHCPFIILKNLVYGLEKFLWTSSRPKGWPHQPAANKHHREGLKRSETEPTKLLSSGSIIHSYYLTSELWLDVFFIDCIVYPNRVQISWRPFCLNSVTKLKRKKGEKVWWKRKNSRQNWKLDWIQYEM